MALMEAVFGKKTAKPPPVVLKNGASEQVYSAPKTPSLERFIAWFNDRVNRSRRSGAMQSETMLVTPAAAEWLINNANNGNRPLTKRRMAYFKKVIEDGAWELCSQGMSVSFEGLLNNGQHRLHGIVQSGRAVEVYFTFGEERQTAFRVLDSGMTTRGGSDTLAILGYKNTKNLAAAARVLLNILAGNYTALYRNDEVEEALKAHPLLDECSAIGARANSKFKGFFVPVIVASYIIRTQSKNASHWDEFMGRLMDGVGLKSRDPILVLRDSIMNDRLDARYNAAARSAGRAAAIILAWNCWIKGMSASTHRLRWSADKPFPQPE